MQQQECQRDDTQHHRDGSEKPEKGAATHGVNVDLGMRCVLSLSLATVTACTGLATGRGDTVIYASGADLQSMNALITTHPLARQVQRYVLLTTLVRYDTLLQPRGYLARAWTWSNDRRVLTMHLFTGLPWSDGAPTTAHDAAWTLDAARDPRTGYPRLADLGAMQAATAIDDSTLVIRYRDPQPAMPDVLTDLAILPAHLLDTVPLDRLRSAAWNDDPVGNGPFTFVSHQSERRWVFAANPRFPAALGGPPRLQAAGDRRGRRTDHQAGRAHRRRARLCRHPARRRRLRGA